MVEQDDAQVRADLATYEFKVFEAMFRTYGNADAAKRNRDEIARMFHEGASADATADIIHEVQVDHDTWANEKEGAR